MRVKVLLNAMHTTTGGGVTYLRGILPELAADTRFAWVLLVPQKTLAGLEIPEGMQVEVAPELDFWRGHVWEQFVLPVLCWRWGVRAVLCNANYVPLLAPRAMPIIHTTPRAVGQAVGWKMQMYWRVLRWLTVVSLWRAPVAFSVARHVVRDYVGSFVGRKVRVAYPGGQVDRLTGGQEQRDPNLVMAVGDFYAQKDYPLIVRAFAVLRERRPASRLLIVGRAVDGGVRDEVLKLVRELKIADAVTMTGAVPHATLMKTLAKAAVYVNASKAECFNLPVLEALACGVPCVLPEVDFQREVAGEAGVFVPVSKGGDVAAAFAVALFGVLENPVIAESLRKRGLARAAEFSWRK
ncbi:MAG: glycosyltransferase, partial [Proteobacteria bacterium]|nr:glycosyltransferase [Pseudomonadota bacterium]